MKSFYRLKYDHIESAFIFEYIFIFENPKTLKEISRIYIADMVKNDENNMSVEKLMKMKKKDIIQMLLEQQKPTVQTPIPAPRKSVNTTIKLMDKALKGYAKSYQISVKNNKDPLAQLQNTRKDIEDHIVNILKSMKGLKFVETLKVTLKKGKTQKTAYFNCETQTITNNNDIAESLHLSEQNILYKISMWISEGSGWVIKYINNHYLNVVKYEPMNGSSYIELPQELRNCAKGLINMKNNDNECFRWCHIRYLNPQDRNPQRIKKEDKLFVDKLDYSGVEFPVEVKHYKKIEKQNDININVFGYENKQPYPIYISKEKHDKHMNILLITEDENKHYVLINDFNKFMYNQTKHKERKHFCVCCLQCFSCERVLNNHKENCLSINGAQAIKMPEKGENILKFENYHKEQPVPFVIYADFEAITEKIHGCKPSDDESYTEAFQKHADCGCGYKVVCCYDDKYTKPIQIYRGEKAVYKFTECMLEERKYCQKIIEKESAKFKSNPKDLVIPVIFHNLRGYDSHFIMQEIGEIVKKNEYVNKKGEKCQMSINAIPNNMEKYMAFMLGNHLKFIDSFQFMSSSLEKLVSNLPKESLIYTSKKFKGEKLNIMLKKGVYPYDYMDSFDKFNEKLPSKEDFYSVLNDQHISDEDYEHAKKVWNTFKLKSMGDYHDLYLTSDILQ